MSAHRKGTVKPLTEDDIRRSLVNGTQGEADRLPLPGLHEVVWEDREFLGWRDPRAAHRGYLAHWRGDEPVVVALRESEVGMARGVAAMCSLCHTPQPGHQVSLFTAARAGEAGEHGNTVGTYICSDLACSIMIRIVPPPSDLQPHPEEIVARRSAGLFKRVDSFIDGVLKPAS
ncbi:MAG: FBP domain-containing protein [Rhodoglobus sp.]